MQGTVVMLMALSGLGCHNKSCDVIYAPPTYGCFGGGGGCYANVYPNYVSPQSFTGCYTGGYSGGYASYYGGGGCFGGGCYGGGYSCYSSCYGGGYRSGHHGCGLLSRLFGCCGRKHFGYYNSSYYNDSYGMDPFSPPIFGYALQYNYGGQAPGTMPSAVDATPSEATVPPVQANPVPTDSPPPPPVVAPSTTPVTPPAPGTTTTPPPGGATTLPGGTTVPPVPQEPPSLTTPPNPVIPNVPGTTPPKPGA
jgi:hypothetical protein